MGALASVLSSMLCISCPAFETLLCCGLQSFQQKKHRDAAMVQAAFEQNIEQELAALAGAPSYDVEVCSAKQIRC